MMIFFITVLIGFFVNQMLPVLLNASGLVFRLNAFSLNFAFVIRFSLYCF